MKINILTCFPKFFSGTMCSLLDKAMKKKILDFNILDLKKYGVGKHKKIDDKPFGGGPGLILKADVVESILNQNFNMKEFDDSKKFQKNKKKIFLLPSPRGKKLTQNMANQLSKVDEIIILCNRYEGIDQRIIDFYKPLEVSIGDYILMGGETAAMAIIESIVRLIPNVIGNMNSVIEESFSEDIKIEYPHYTHPRVWNDLKVPEVLLSGNHKEIFKWRNGKK